tara:strand:- start:7058 stop:7582 length:525 start_codon:yes stop_codon:yes gene_type:complete
VKYLKLITAVLICLLLFAFSKVEYGESDTLTTLFKIERSKDKNQIFYDVNIDESGNFDIENPINIYWIKNTEGGKVKPLTWIQKKYAYGLKFLKIDPDYATFRFVSTKKMHFILKKTKDNHFEVYSKYKGQLLNIKRIFIQMDRGSFWFPNIKAVEVYAKNVKTGKAVIEIITP